MNLNLDDAISAVPPAVSLTAEIQDVVRELTQLSEVISLLNRRALYLSLLDAKARQESLLCRVDLECSGEDATMRAQLLVFRNAQRQLLHEAALCLYPDEWGTPTHPAAPERVADFLLSRRRGHAHV